MALLVVSVIILHQAGLVILIEDVSLDETETGGAGRYKTEIKLLGYTKLPCQNFKGFGSSKTHLNAELSTIILVQEAKYISCGLTIYRKSTNLHLCVLIVPHFNFQGLV